MKQKVLLTSGGVAGLATLVASIVILTGESKMAVRFLAMTGYWAAFGLTLFFVGLALPAKEKK